MTKEMTAQARAKAKYYKKNREAIHTKSKAKNMTVTLPREFVMNIRALADHRGITLAKLIIDKFDLKEDTQ